MNSTDFENIVHQQVAISLNLLTKKGLNIQARIYPMRPAIDWRTLRRLRLL